VNLMRVSGEGVERGATLCVPGSMQPSGLLDVRLQLLKRAPRPMKQRTRIRLHHGTAELLGRAYLLDRDALAPGDSCPAQLRLEGLVAASRGDRCVVRSYSPMLTIGGAVVLDPTPVRHRRRDEEVLARLETLAAGDPLEVAREWVARRGAVPFASRDLASALQIEPAEAERLVAGLVERGDLRALGTDGALVSAEAHDALQAGVAAAVRDFHAARRLQASMPKDALQAALQRPHAGLLADVLARLAAEGRIEVEPGGVRARGWQVRLSAEQEGALEAMVRLARDGGFSPPTREALLAVGRRPEVEARALLARLTDNGELVPVGEHVYHRVALEEVQRRVRQHFRAKGPFTVAELRDLTGSSRKYCVPLAEHLDGIGFTRRQGDLRIVTRPDDD
jgi:selenocysteine-specific elongation factor